MTTIEEELDQYMDIFSSLAIEYVILEAVEQIIYPVVEREPPVITSPNDNATPEATPGVIRSSRVRVQTNQEYIQLVSGKQYETTNSQVEYKETLHPDAHMMFYN